MPEIVGSVALALVIVRRITLARPPRPVKVLCVRPMVLGFSVAGATAIGAWWLPAWPRSRHRA